MKNAWDLSCGSWKRVPSWLMPPRLFWCSLAWTGLALFLGWLPAHLNGGQTQDILRYMGWTLQMAGLAAVYTGLNDKLSLYEGRGIRTMLWQMAGSWLNRCPLLRREQTIDVGTTLNFSQVTRARIDGSVTSNASLDQKVAFLMNANRQMQDAIHNLTDRLDKQTKAQQNADDSIRKELRAVEKKVTTQAQEAAVGGIGWEIVGLAWVFIGITLGTVPDMIA